MTAGTEFILYQIEETITPLQQIIQDDPNNDEQIKL